MADHETADTPKAADDDPQELVIKRKFGPRLAPFVRFLTWMIMLTIGIPLLVILVRCPNWPLAGSVTLWALATVLAPRVLVDGIAPLQFHLPLSVQLKEMGLTALVLALICLAMYLFSLQPADLLE